MIYWIFLSLAITTEIIGTLSMKYASINGEIIGYIIMYLMIITSYTFLSFAIKRVDLGVAYAVWEGVGILFITIFSILWFNDTFSLVKLVGLTILVFGIILLKSGTSKSKSRAKK